MEKKKSVRHRCDWMTDRQLKGFIESLTGLLHEALEEQKERAQIITRREECNDTIS